MIRLVSKLFHSIVVWFPDRSHVDLASEWNLWMGAYMSSLRGSFTFKLPTLSLNPTEYRSGRSYVVLSVLCSSKNSKIQYSWSRLVFCAKTSKRDASRAMLAWFLSWTPHPTLLKFIWTTKTYLNSTSCGGSVFSLPLERFLIIRFWI